MTSAKKKEHARRVLNLLIALCLITAIITSLITRKSTIEVVAIAESAEFTTSDAHPVSWYVDGIQLKCDQPGNARDFSGRIELSSRVRVLVQRISGGPVLIDLKVEDNEAHVATLYPEGTDGPFVVGPRLCLIAADPAKRAALGKNIVLPVSGDVVLGSASEMRTTASSPVLRSGQISVIGRTLFGDDMYKSATQTLVLGDSVTFHDSEGPAIGLLTIDERPGISETFRAKAKGAFVQRLPATGYDVGLTLLDRIQKDDSIQAIWAAFLFLLGLRKLGE